MHFWELHYIVVIVAHHSVVSDSLWPHGLQHARLPCPSLFPEVCSDSWPLSRWCHSTISCSVTPFSCPHSFSASGLFQLVSSSHWVAKVLELQHRHQSFQWIFRVDFWFDFEDWLTWSPCCPRDSQESSLAAQFESISSLLLSLLYGPTLTSVHDCWKNHSLRYMDLCWKSDVSAS